MKRMLFLISLLVLSLTIQGQLTIDSVNVQRSCESCLSPTGAMPLGEIYIEVSGGLPPYTFTLSGNISSPSVITTNNNYCLYNSLCQDTFILSISDNIGNTLIYNFETTPMPGGEFTITNIIVKKDSTNNPNSGYIEVIGNSNNVDSIFFKIEEQSGSIILGSLGGWQTSNIFDSLPGGYYYNLYIDVYPKPIPSCGTGGNDSILSIYVPLSCESGTISLSVSPSFACMGDDVMVVISGLASTDSLTSDVFSSGYVDFGNGQVSSLSVGGSSLYDVHYTTYPPGIYSVQVYASTNQGCIFKDSAEVIVYDIPVSDFTYSDNGNGLYSFTNLSTGIGNYPTFFWDFGDGNTSTAYSPQHQYTISGTYLVCLTVYNDASCSSTYCDSIHYNGSITQINNVEKYPFVVYYHNGEIIIKNQHSQTIKDIDLYDISGRTIPFHWLEANKIKPISISKGIYLMEIKLENNGNEKRKLIKLFIK